MRVIPTFLAGALAFAGAPAVAQTHVKIGVLDCAVKSGQSTVLSSAKDLSCSFLRGDDAPADVYFGQIRRVGIELGATEGGVIRWVVLAPSEDVAIGALAGDYIGVSAEATVGLGLGANVLMGGSDSSFALQPVSLQAQTGLNLAAGIAELELRSFQ